MSGFRNGANKILTCNQGTSLHLASVAIGATGAVGTIYQAGANLIQSVTRLSAGRYSVQLKNPVARKKLAIDGWLSAISAAGLEKHARYEADSYNADTGVFIIQVVVPASSAGTPASGSIQFDTVANHGTANTFTLGDGINPAKIYELDKAGDGVTGTNVAIDISGATTAAQVAALARTKILATQPALAVTDVGAGLLTLVHTLPGVIGNVAMSKTGTSALAVVGMTGGAGAGTTAASDPTSGTELFIELSESTALFT